MAPWQWGVMRLLCQGGRVGKSLSWCITHLERCEKFGGHVLFPQPALSKLLESGIGWPGKLITWRQATPSPICSEEFL
jgi:hypothetical protein